MEFLLGQGYTTNIELNNSILDEEGSCIFFTTEDKRIVYLDKTLECDNRAIDIVHLVTIRLKWEDIVNHPEYDWAKGLKPYDKVLTRDYLEDNWAINFFQEFHYDTDMNYECFNGFHTYCVPYKGNEHFLGTNFPENANEVLRDKE